MKVNKIKNKDIIIIFILIIVILILLNYDTMKKEFSSPKNMQIRETYFSEETNQVLDIFKNEIKFFEYKTNKKVKAVKVEFWENNGENWEKFGEIKDNISKGKYDIALNTTGNLYKFYSLTSKGITPYTYKSSVNFNEDIENIYTIFLEQSNNKDIVLNEEIVLFSKYSFEKVLFNGLANYKELEKYKQTEISSLSSNVSANDFRSVKCKEGVAITITFLDKEIQ